MAFLEEKDNSVLCDKIKDEADDHFINKDNENLYTAFKKDLAKLLQSKPQSLVSWKKTHITIHGILSPQVIFEMAMPPESSLSVYAVQEEEEEALNEKRGMTYIKEYCNVKAKENESEKEGEENKEKTKAEQTKPLSDLDKDTILIRPRIQSICYHPNIYDTGTLIEYLHDESLLKEHNLSFDSMLSYANACRCEFFYSMPCTFEEFVRKSPEEKKELVAKLRANLGKFQIQRVQRQQKLINTAVSRYKPLYPKMFQLKEWDWNDVLDQRFVSAFKKGQSAFLKLCKTEIDYVFSFPLFSLSFCEQVVTELRNYETTDLPKERPNSMVTFFLLLLLLIDEWIDSENANGPEQLRRDTELYWAGASND
ncbi:hypothetical protein RFI_14566 [Reticulomyxa filosa]|uniref:Uncharacterized protein n=1 Tax=Reticulomyxa filosa TaxID=46433 RepID=X6NA39_RETFI|nr:hypothetical protein RFI_14566 [Reticulomyxa filosa]|eukprot:ETO22629.1 hypothetical protein RFI_14566 [Reticulomyxa filosa]